MIGLIGVWNVVLGVVYLTYAVLTLVELARRRGAMLSLERRYAWAWVLMALTCGPHHLIHGLFSTLHAIAPHGNPLAQIGFLCHLTPGGVAALTPNYAGADWLIVLVGFPAGLTWFVLQLGGATGRWRSDVHFRIGNGNLVVPGLVFCQMLLFVAIGALIGGNLHLHFPSHSLLSIVTNLLLVVLYKAIAFQLVRTQLGRHHAEGRWSLSGLSLGIVFATCALMHLVYAWLLAQGVYVTGSPLAGIDLIAVPIACYFLAVIVLISRSPDFERV